jgi:hypothetical protein
MKVYERKLFPKLFVQISFLNIIYEREWILSSSKINWGNNVRNGPLDYKCMTIFKYKRNWEKLIDGWDVKIEEKEIERIHSHI